MYSDGQKKAEACALRFRRAWVRLVLLVGRFLCGRTVRRAARSGLVARGAGRRRRAAGAHAQRSNSLLVELTRSLQTFRLLEFLQRGLRLRPHLAVGGPGVMTGSAQFLLRLLHELGALARLLRALRLSRLAGALRLRGLPALRLRLLLLLLITRRHRTHRKRSSNCNGQLSKLHRVSFCEYCKGHNRPF